METWKVALNAKVFIETVYVTFQFIFFPYIVLIACFNAFLYTIFYDTIFCESLEIMKWFFVYDWDVIYENM